MSQFDLHLEQLAGGMMPIIGEKITLSAGGSIDAFVRISEVEEDIGYRQHFSLGVEPKYSHLLKEGEVIKTNYGNYAIGREMVEESDEPLHFVELIRA